MRDFESPHSNYRDTAAKRVGNVELEIVKRSDAANSANSHAPSETPIGRKRSKELAI
jgi:hypothetical protein